MHILTDNRFTSRINSQSDLLKYVGVWYLDFMNAVRKGLSEIDDIEQKVVHILYIKSKNVS